MTSSYIAIGIILLLLGVSCFALAYDFYHERRRKSSVAPPARIRKTAALPMEAESTGSLSQVDFEEVSPGRLGVLFLMAWLRQDSSSPEQDSSSTEVLSPEERKSREALYSMLERITEEAGFLSLLFSIGDRLVFIRPESPQSALVECEIHVYTRFRLDAIFNLRFSNDVMWCYITRGSVVHPVTGDTRQLSLDTAGWIPLDSASAVNELPCEHARWALVHSIKQMAIQFRKSRAHPVRDDFFVAST